MGILLVYMCFFIFAVLGQSNIYVYMYIKRSVGMVLEMIVCVCDETLNCVGRFIWSVDRIE